MLGRDAELEMVHSDGSVHEISKDRNGKEVKNKLRMAEQFKLAGILRGC